MHLQIWAKHVHSSSVRFVSSNERLITMMNSPHRTPDIYNGVPASELAFQALIIVNEELVNRIYIEPNVGASLRRWITSWSHWLHKWALYYLWQEPRAIFSDVHCRYYLQKNPNLVYFTVVLIFSLKLAPHSKQLEDLSRFHTLACSYSMHMTLMGNFDSVYIVEFGTCWRSQCSCIHLCLYRANYLSVQHYYSVYASCGQCRHQSCKIAL